MFLVGLLSILAGTAFLYSAFTEQEQPQSQPPGKSSVETPQSTSSSVETPQSASSTEELTEPVANISLTKGRLSMSVERVPVQWIVEQIASKSMVPMIWDSRAEDRLVTVDFRGLRLDQGLLEILRDYDTFFFYGAGNEHGDPASVTVVWIYPKGKGLGLKPVPPEDWASTKESQATLFDADPEVRSRSIQTLVERMGQRAEQAVLDTLSDEDADVRTAALYAAVSSGVELPAYALTDLALKDPSSSVRFLALQGLEAAEYSEIQWIAEEARNDPNPHVQLKARKILERLDRASQITEAHNFNKEYPNE